MKHHPPFQTILGLLYASSFFPSLAESGHCHRLSMQARPIGEISFDNNAVWDLSNNDRISRHIPVCVAYGDTLLSETVEGERRWYALYPDSASLIREESRLYEHQPTVPIPTAALGNDASSTPIAYVTNGLHSHLFRIDRTGTYLSRPPVKGRLIVAPQDTVPALMTSEPLTYPTLETTSPAHNTTDKGHPIPMRGHRHIIPFTFFGGSCERAATRAGTVARISSGGKAQRGDHAVT